MNETQAIKFIENETAIADRLCSDYEKVNEGYCLHCGQIGSLGLNVFTEQCEADSYVTQHCDCAASVKQREKNALQDRYDDEVDRIMRRRQDKCFERENIKEDIKETISQLFGDLNEQSGKICLCTEVITYLIDTAMLCYDGLTADVNLKVCAGVNAKISCKNGVVSIERKEASKMKRDVM